MIEFNNEKDLKEFDEALTKLITEVIDKALKFEGFLHNYEVSVTITDNLSIKEYNNEYRNIDRETDVLSFPMLEFNSEDIEKHVFPITEEDKNPENGSVVLGDIILSLEKANQQAEDFGHSFHREVAFLIVHSVLHLLGFDHLEPIEEAVMRKEEEAILSSMNLTR